MKEVNLFSISGLFYEYYDLDYSSIFDEDSGAKDIDLLRNINGSFWREVFSEKNVLYIMKCLEQGKEQLANVKYKAVANNPKCFVKNIRNALFITSYHDLSMKEFFSALESLTIYCELYSEYISYPHKLTIEDGFRVNEVDSNEMIKNALNVSRNPYYKFLESYAFEKLKEYKADIIWLRGKIRLSSLTMAMIAKKYNPNVHISVVGHSSEYYSLNKITEFLKNNLNLFNVVDSIILNDDKKTMQQLYNAIKNGQGLENVNNLLYIDRDCNEVKQTSYVNSTLSTYDWIQRRKNDIAMGKEICAYNVVNIRLWPNSICFWNRCTFCGINKKYVGTNEIVFSNVSEKVDIIQEIYKEKGEYYWFVDEAVTPSAINEFARLLLERKIDIKWQIRSRIDYEFEQVDFDLLYQSGLREIRLGLESGSIRVRKLMKKFSKEIDNNYIENLVKRFNDHGISVHFPIIIGFPTETDKEREETYSFLKKMKRKYPLMSFNVNILGLDVSSAIFKDSYKYGIKEIKFPCDPRTFIGNLVDFRMWDDSFNYQRLDIERESFMRQVLYPWMPTNSLMNVSIFYRLSETSRNTLIWKCKQYEKREIQPETTINLSKEVSILQSDKSMIWAYSLKSHHEIMCDGSTANLFNLLLQKSDQISNIIEELMLNDTFDYDWEDYWKEINTLIELEFVEVN